MPNLEKTDALKQVGNQVRFESKLKPNALFVVFPILKNKPKPYFGCFIIQNPGLQTQKPQ